MNTLNDKRLATRTAAIIALVLATGCSNALLTDGNHAALSASDDLVVEGSSGGAAAEPERPEAGFEQSECEELECEFTTYNLDVQVGDAFVLSHFVDCGGVAVAHSFAYEEGEEWNLEAFNRGDLVTVTEADLQGGNKGEGEYRFVMLDELGEEFDHMTIRVGHGDDSDIEAQHALAPAAPTTEPGACAGDAEGNTDEDDDSTGDGGTTGDSAGGGAGTASGTAEGGGSDPKDSVIL